MCERKRNRSTTLETDNQGTGKARKEWIQNLLRLLLHVGGRTCHSDSIEAFKHRNWPNAVWPNAGMTKPPAGFGFHECECESSP